MKTAKRERVPGVSVKNTKPTLTKAEMIREIQVAEAKAWKEYNENKALYGPAEAVTTRCRTTWSALYELRKQLGVDGLPVIELLEMNLLPTHESPMA